MEQYISKSALVAEIDKGINGRNDWHLDEYRKGYHDALIMLKKYLSILEVKEVNLELITGWFDHIAQIADDRMTLTNQRMTDAHALDEIKCLARNSSEFIKMHYKAQKGE